MAGMPFDYRSFPRAILHIDGDSFFASCEQAGNPRLQGKPVITGKERGIVSSMSYEAKARGITRAIKLSEALRICPDAIILPSDYETYSLLSRRFFNIVRRYTPDVEEYGIDEGFADITGLRRNFHASYKKIAERIQQDLLESLGFTFSVGLAPTKVLAKLASKWKKPYGLTAINSRDIPTYLQKLPVGSVWGIGPQTTAYLAKFGIRTALDFALKDESWIQEYLTKPGYEIWQELRGQQALKLELTVKSTCQSIQKVKTFTPPSNKYDFVFAQLAKNIENACIKARRYSLAAQALVIMLKTQDFRYEYSEMKLSRKSAYPSEIIDAVEGHFKRMFSPRKFYRATGVTLLKLDDETTRQADLFGDHLTATKMRRVYHSVDELQKRYGKHTVFVATSFAAHTQGAHQGARSNIAERYTKHRLPGETRRKHLGLPMFLGEIN